MSEEIKKLWVTRLDNFFFEMKLLTKANRWQYKTDIKALMCRGIEDEEVTRIK